MPLMDSAIANIDVTLAHHSQSQVDHMLFDAGWRFQMALQTPLSAYAAPAAAAVATPITH
jgi:hypothetical protein